MAYYGLYYIYRFYSLKKALENSTLSKKTIAVVCLSALLLTLGHATSTIIAYFLLVDSIPFPIKGVEICLHGADGNLSDYSVLYLGLPLFVCGGLFLSHDMMSVGLLRANATNNPEIERRR